MYLVGYDSTNIFRIWIPHQGKVISTRDVIFDENTFFDGKVESDGQLLATVDDLIARIQLDPLQIKNEEILLETDGEILNLEGTCDSEGSYDDDGDIEMFTEKEDDELFIADEEGLITPPPSVIEDAFATYLPFQGVNIGSGCISTHKNDDPSRARQNGYHHGYEDWEERFECFQRVRLKWFLGIHVLRDRQQKKLWLSQKAYIDKLVTKFNIDVTGKLPTTPMTEAELLPSTTNAPKSEAVQYQRKTGSILFAAVITRPDIAFAMSRLSRFNTNPNESHQNAADRVLRYLYNTRGYCIQYGSTNTMMARIYDGDLICASDASFADNTLDRKTSQGYIMTLFGGPIAWRANKQDTVTTSSTEAELLAMPQAAKEAIFLSRILKALTLRLDDPLTIYCDNKQTLRLVTEETAKLVTKLRHVDIHTHWLRQEVKNKRVETHWVSTKDMMVDGLTKSLGHQKHVHFVAMHD